MRADRESTTLIGVHAGNTVDCVLGVNIHRDISVAAVVRASTTAVLAHIDSPPLAPSRNDPIV